MQVCEYYSQLVHKGYLTNQFQCLWIYVSLLSLNKSTSWWNFKQKVAFNIQRTFFSRSCCWSSQSFSSTLPAPAVLTPTTTTTVGTHISSPPSITPLPTASCRFHFSYHNRQVQLLELFLHISKQVPWQGQNQACLCFDNMIAGTQKDRTEIQISTKSDVLWKTCSHDLAPW